MLNDMSIERMGTIPVNLHLVNDDPSIRVDEEPLVIAARTRGSGFARLYRNAVPLAVDVKLDSSIIERDGSFFIDTNQLVKKLRRRREVSFDDREIQLPADRLAQRTVPLRTNLIAPIRPGYKLKEQVQVSQDSITLLGPVNEIAKYTEIVLDSIRIATDADLINQRIQIPLGSDQVRAEPDTVELTGAWQQVVEVTKQITIEQRNFPKSSSARLYPTSVQIIYTTTADAQVADESPVVFVDFNKIDANQLNIIPEVQVDESKVFSYRIVPATVQMLVVE